MASGLSSARHLPADTINRLHHLYAHHVQAIDDGDAEAWASTFTPDGSFRSPTYGRDIVGHAALCEFVRARASDDGRAQERHWFNGFQFTPGADGTIHNRFYGMIVSTGTGAAPVILRSLVIEDVLVEIEGHWRIADRKVDVDGLG